MYSILNLTTHYRQRTGLLQLGAMTEWSGVATPAVYINSRRHDDGVSVVETDGIDGMCQGFSRCTHTHTHTMILAGSSANANWGITLLFCWDCLFGCWFWALEDDFRCHQMWLDLRNLDKWTNNRKHGDAPKVGTGLGVQKFALLPGQHKKCYKKFWNLSTRTIRWFLLSVIIR